MLDEGISTLSAQASNAGGQPHPCLQMADTQLGGEGGGVGKRRGRAQRNGGWLGGREEGRKGEEVKRGKERGGDGGKVEGGREKERRVQERGYTAKGKGRGRD